MTTLATDYNAARRRQIEEEARQVLAAMVDSMIKARKAQDI